MLQIDSRLARVTRAGLVCMVFASSASAWQGAVTSPSEHLGRPLGVDFDLADWQEVSGYHRLLAEQSPRVRIEVVGTTTEGRDFLLSTISSERNLARLDEILAGNARLADPRGLDGAARDQLLDDGPVTILISPGMHSTETAGPQFGMEFAYLLATSEQEPWPRVRERVVVGLMACTNPDGVDHVVSWYRENRDTPYEGTSLTRLYQLYAGHDNNRDWFMLSLEETRIVTRLLYHRWFPQVYWDVHQQGRSGERLFVPPFRDPLDPNLDPGVITGIGVLGGRMLADLTRAGLKGVSTGVSYDMWWNGGNRNVPVRHNIVGLLTEAASVNLASPVFLRHGELRAPRGLDHYAPSNRFPDPWPGGWWRLRDIIDYELAAARSLLGSLSREPAYWRRTTLEAAERSLAGGRDGTPRAWIFPADQPDRAAARRLVDALMLGGVELGVAEEAIEADGRSWPAGSLVVSREQPYGTFAKDLFEVQHYPEGDEPYDVTGWTLPALLGLHRVEVVGPRSGRVRPVTTVDDALAAFGTPTEAGRLPAADGDTWPAVFAGLAAGQTWSFITDGAEAGDFVEGRHDRSIVLTRAPRIALYAPWSGSMDEGWMRWVFDRFGIHVVTVRNETLRAGRLADAFDVLVLPSVGSGTLDRGRATGSVDDRFAGGLDAEGGAAVEQFVRGGGTLVTVGASSAWAIDRFELPLVDVTRGPDAADFSCPGALLYSVPSLESPFSRDLAPSVPLFFSRSSAFRVEEKGADRVTVLQRYAPSGVLLSGWIQGPEVIENQAAWVRATHGEGRIHVFGYRPAYRAWTQGTFALLFRAILLDGGR